MVSMATECHTVLKQGNCKNAFCQGILPDGKITIVKPPIGDPDARKDEYWLLKRTLYGPCRSPCHWYTRINAALNAIGLHANSSDPCLYTGHIVNPSNLDAPPTSSPLTLGLYMWMTSSTSQTTPMLNAFLSDFSLLWLRSILWALLNGFSALISNDIKQKMRYPSISAKQALQRILSRTTMLTFVA
jgi:hypothetical protein